MALGTVAFLTAAARDRPGSANGPNRRLKMRLPIGERSQPLSHSSPNPITRRTTARPGPTRDNRRTEFGHRPMPRFPARTAATARLDATAKLCLNPRVGVDTEGPDGCDGYPEAGGTMRRQRPHGFRSIRSRINDSTARNRRAPLWTRTISSNRLPLPDPESWQSRAITRFPDRSDGTLAVGRYARAAAAVRL